MSNRIRSTSVAGVRPVGPLGRSLRLGTLVATLGSLCGLALTAPAAPPVSASPTAGPSEEEFTAEELAFFEERIRPVLVESCYECHSSEGTRLRGGLLVDSRAGLLAGGDFGPAVVPGDLEASLLWSAINHADIAMPPREKLADDVLADFRTWILMGAPDTRVGTAPPAKTTVTAADIEAGRDWWSFQPVGRPAIPHDERDDWSRTDVDRFVHAQWAEQGLRPNEDVDARGLLRRLSFDLIGLPPAPAELDAFERAYRKDAEGAVAAAIDGYLEDPGFGERWGRHWLDVARYAESTGRELNAIYPHAWRYRDWVIDAINADVPYDRFVQAQLAGDLLPVDSDEEWAANLVATGFLSVGTKGLRERSRRQFQADLVDEQIDTTTRALLGVSVACARCHDHKYEPIQQADYYALAGIFESTATYFGTEENAQSRQSSQLITLPVSDVLPSNEGLTPTAMAEMREELADLYDSQDALRRQRRLDRLRQARGEMDDGSVPAGDAQDLVRQQRRIDRQITQLESRLGAVDRYGEPLTFCMGVQEVDRPRDARLLIRGEVENQGDPVPRGLVQVLDDPASPFRIQEGSSGRLELARWMTAEDNPLTARVFVNRVWLHLLGAGIVTSTEDFGTTGAPPSHPELLEHLSAEFMASGWSLKELVRTIASSRVYALSSQHATRSFELDPENRFLWRANERQLEAEVVRDSMLAIAGNLDRVRPQGSAVAELGDRPLGGRLTRLEDLAPNETYRSVYLPVPRDAVPHALGVFDFASPDAVVGVRERTSTPTQALYLLNNDFVQAQSTAFARRLREEEQSLSKQVGRAFELVFGRGPEGAERRESIAYVKATAASLEDRDVRGADLKALASFCQALLASAEFRFVD